MRCRDGADRARVPRAAGAADATCATDATCAADATCATPATGAADATCAVDATCDVANCGVVDANAEAAEAAADDRVGVADRIAGAAVATDACATARDDACEAVITAACAAMAAGAAAAGTAAAADALAAAAARDGVFVGGATRIGVAATRAAIACTLYVGRGWPWPCDAAVAACTVGAAGGAGTAGAAIARGIDAANGCPAACVAKGRGVIARITRSSRGGIIEISGSCGGRSALITIITMNRTAAAATQPARMYSVIRGAMAGLGPRQRRARVPNTVQDGRHDEPRHAAR